MVRFLISTTVLGASLIVAAIYEKVALILFQLRESAAPIEGSPSLRHSYYYRKYAISFCMCLCRSLTI